ncbi:MAG: acyltransferase [Formivibrio sp.]|nr:acyltransferase [Formivibrio sp.]
MQQDQSHAVNTAPAQRFVVLDSFRGLCALSVVVFHLHISGSFTDLPFFRSAGLFVEFFFTLSGFVLCHSYAQRTFDAARFRAFLISRTCRIFPLHLAALLFCTLLVYVQRGFHLGRAVLSEWGPNALLLQAWLPKTNAFSYNGPAWSISIEFYLYLIFGLLLFALFRWSKALFGWIALLCSVCVWLNAGWIGTGGFRGITCFFIGTLAYEGYRRSQHWRMPWISLLEVAALAGIYFCLTLQYAHKSYWATCYFALCIMLFAREGGWISRQLLRPVFVKLGHWSFSIYLTHFVAISLLMWLAPDLGLDLEQPENSALTYLTTGSIPGDFVLTLTILAGVLGISNLTYKHIEQRGIALGRRLAGKTKLLDAATGLKPATNKA